MRTRQIVTLVLFLVLVSANVTMERWYSTIFTPAQTTQTKTQALLSVLGGLRAFVAKMIWFKVDLYHHKIESTGVESSTDPNILAFERFITILDPHFVPAYDVGSFGYFSSSRIPQALDFVSEGVKNNPDVAILLWDKSFYEYRLKQFEAGFKDSARAFQLTPPEDDVSQINCLRILSLCAQGIGDVQTEVWALKTWLKIRPGDIVPIARLKALLVKSPQPATVPHQ